ncbi:MAG: hypothetical protein JWP89_4255 [Schlesneria sp.]|nr:hypothetical protein [Schlesneria sp.]
MRPGAEVVSCDTLFHVANLAKRLGRSRCANNFNLTFAKDLGNLGYSKPKVVSCAARENQISRLCQLCHASAEASSPVFQLKICIFQFAI